MTPEEQLERFIDSHSLKYVIEQIAYICQEKADHVRTSWQDQNLASTWDEDAIRVTSLTKKIKN